MINLMEMNDSCHGQVLVRYLFDKKLKAFHFIFILSTNFHYNLLSSSRDETCREA